MGPGAGAANSNDLAVLLGLSIMVFSLSRMVGDPVAGYVDPYTPLYQIEQIRVKYHLDEPLYIQYFYWLSAVFRGDFGLSRIYIYRPVFYVIQIFAPVTLELALYTMIFMIPISLWLATKSVAHRDRLVDHISRLIAISGHFLYIGLQTLGPELRLSDLLCILSLQITPEKEETAPPKEYSWVSSEKSDYR